MENKAKTWVNVLSILLWLICGVGLGLCIIFTADMDKILDESLGSFLVAYGFYMLLAVIVFLIQLIIHEAGHLVFGLLSGYKFNSFRIMSLIISKKDGKLTLGRKKVAGTGGQCLMSPPDYNDGNYSYILYNLGGCILNLISAVIFALLFIAAKDVPVLNTFLAELAVVGVINALINGIPMQTKDVPNDGYNALHTGDSAQSRKSFWTQLKMSEYSFNGVRAKDMPEELFFIPTDEDKDNAIVSSSAVFYEYRLMDEGKYKEANDVCYKLLDGGYTMPGIHRNLMVFDRIVTDLLLQNGKCSTEELKEPKMANYLKKMIASPEVLRTRYVVSLLAENDEAEANKRLEEFGKIAKTYPNKGDLVASLDIMEKARELYDEQAAGAVQMV